IALAEKEGLVLTSAMKADLAALIEAAKNELENNPDAAEIKEYARVMTEEVKRIQGYEGDVKVIIETIDFLKKENNGFGGYADKALANAVNYDTCHTAAQLNDVFRKELRIARKRNAAERRTEQYTGMALSELQEGMDFYLYNVGCHQFMKGTGSWGAHQGVGYASNAFTLEGPRPDPETGESTPFETPNTWRINTHRNNGGILEYMNWGGYCDTDTKDGWQLIPVEGKTNVFHIIQAGQTNGVTGGYNYLGLRDGDNNWAVDFNMFNIVDTDMRTPELETNQWMLISPDEMNSFIATATKDKPADITHLLINPCFDQRLSIDEWYREAEGGNVQSEGRGNDRVDLAFEAWNSQAYQLFQEIYDFDNLQPGWYSVYVQAYYRDGSYEEEAKNKVEGGPIYRDGYLFASWSDTDETATASTPLWSISDCANMSPGLGRLDASGTVRFPDACWSASEEYFHMGLYWNRLDFEVPAETACGYLKVGVMKQLNEAQEQYKERDWLVCDNFRIKYYGTEKPDPTAIDAVEGKGAQQPTSLNIYNLAGQRLSKMQKGVNIVGGKKY
ncbi:MAG: hypothetical protein HUK03_09705, partial [Bacteroidaceae bacterium]|nr:hypothetical protein [Bacteroidaceae bacterium]